ncbi:uncharacterized protein LOC123664276 [Melitaea cinxia]|uniref:uncharacterized protein LOC123664276 n=1 Tax=Melitaea cinxia TaxID=113334 RepID=UPI001E26F2C7|nr:uncharacterized protein LOC123664276 [Melitaea cinxia]
MGKLEVGLTKNPKLFWSLVKSKRGGSSRYPASMSDGNITTSDTKIICDMFASNFSSVYEQNHNTKTNVVRSDFLLSLKLNSMSLEAPLLDKESILAKLVTLDDNKGAGPDDVPPSFIKTLAGELVHPLLTIFNTSLSTGVFPSVWKTAKVVPVYKNGNGVDAGRSLGGVSCPISALVRTVSGASGCFELSS